MAIHEGSSPHPKNNTGLPNTLFGKTAFTTCLQKSSPNVVITRAKRRNTADVERIGDRGSSSKPWFHFDHVSCKKARRNTKTGFKPKSLKLLPATKEISAYKYAESTSFPASQRLYDENRSPSGLFSCTNREIAPSISEVHFQRYNVPDDLLSIRACKCTKNVCNVVQLDSTEAQRKRNKGTSVLGRLPPGESLSSSSSTTYETGHRPYDQARMGNKQEKVVRHTRSRNRLSWNSLEHPAKSKKSPSKEGNLTKKPTSSHSKVKKSITLRSSKNYGNSTVFQLCSKPWDAKIPQYSVVPKPGAENGCDSSTKPCSQKRRQMVATEYVYNKRNLVSHSILPYHHRRISERLGSVCQRQSHSRSVVTRRASLSFEPKRVTGCLQSSYPQKCSQRLQQQERPCSKRQPNRSSIFTQTRRHEIHHSDAGDKNDLPSLRTKQHQSNNQLPSGHTQWYCGQSVQVQGPSGMAPLASGLPADLRQVGDTSGGPDGIQTCTCSSKIRSSRLERPTSYSPRRFQPGLGSQAGMDISSTVSNVQSPIVSERSQGNIHSDLSEMEERFLEDRSKETSNSPSVHHQEPGISADRHENEPTPCAGKQTCIRGMEMSGWDDLLDTWSPTEINIIESSWRPSTLKTYKPAWTRWLKWCKEHGINNKTPGGQGLAKYLIYLHTVEGLSYKTIQVHKSVVSSFCKPQSEEKLSSNILVRQTLRGLANKSAAKDKVKPPVWNPQVVIEWLLQSDPNLDSLFEAARRCATLLLLASGRRVHDLTLLSVKEDKCIIEDGSITFWPLFGSKTDTINHKQSGWLLLSGDNWKIDPVFWIKKLIHKSEQRRMEGGNINSLFVSTRGKPKPASRTIIAGWVKTVLVDAGIQDSPGSIRSAVASLNWVNEMPLEDILARGNWTSSNTLIRFYKRPVKPCISSNTPCIVNNFSPL